SPHRLHSSLLSFPTRRSSDLFTRTWWDDSDFTWRLNLAGARIVFDPRASLIHLKTSCGGKRPKRVDEYILADTETWGILFYFWRDRKSTRLNSSHSQISYAVF